MGYYAKAKVYCDGSHYIAIPHTERHTKPRVEKKEELVKVDENDNYIEKYKDVDVEFDERLEDIEIIDDKIIPVDKEKKVKLVSPKERFERLYLETNNMSRKDRRKVIIEGIKGSFPSLEKAVQFVDENMYRKYRNLVLRRMRFCRKAYLYDMNYFCTFTYDDKLMTEKMFKKKLINTLSNFKRRNGWEYMGVWERGEETNRLHFHGVFLIPEGQMKGNIEEVKDYDYKTHKITIKHQNDYFLYRFGRNDFNYIPNKQFIGSAIEYIVKYLEKTGEKIISSKGLSEFIVSDILDEDIFCKMSSNKEYEGDKLILVDDFTCIDEGTIIGKMSPEVLKEMPKSK